MFGKKVFQVEVIDGVDLEEKTYLTGDRVSVGSGGDDDLRLGGGRIVPGHVVFARSENGKGWEYFTSGAGEIEISKGNPRTGPVRAGLTMRLGPDTRIKITREPLPPELADEGGDEPKEIPLAVALPVMAVFAVGFAFYVQMLTSDGPQDTSGLQTAAWLTDMQGFGRNLDVCLAAAGPETNVLVPADAPDANFRAYSLATVEGTEEEVGALRLTLGRAVRRQIVDAHLLVDQNRFGDAADELRDVLAMLPTGNAACPINSAVRSDFSVLQRRADR
jgi:hypothetical protein